jgi:hypothetical protein
VSQRTLVDVPKLRVLLHSRATITGSVMDIGTNAVDLSSDAGHILSCQIEKGQGVTGGCSIELQNTANTDWEHEISNGDYVELYVKASDDLYYKLKMSGMVNSVGFSSTTGGGQARNRVAIKVVDLGILFTKFARLMHDSYWGSTKFGVSAIFAEAYDRTKESLTESSYDLKSIFTTTWKNILKPYFDAVQTLTGEPFMLGNGATLDDTFGSNGEWLFDTVADTFDFTYPMVTQINEAYQGLWQFWEQASNPPFNELWGDTCYEGQEIDLFEQGQLPHVITVEGYRIICRPNPWLYNHFERMRTNVIPPVKVESVEGTKSASEVKSMYLVYPISDFNHANSYKASGDYAIDERLFSLWGVAIEEKAIHYVKATDAAGKPQNPEQYVKQLSGVLKDGFDIIDRVYAGTVSMRYHDVRVGQKIQFPQKVTDLNQTMRALVQKVTDRFKYDSNHPQSTTTVTYVRGVF